jgi:hypothetical protein
VHLGGTLQFGSSEETSCFVMPAVGHPSPWPFTIYPSGKVEVVFQHMANRPPFDDAELRVQFQKRLDSIQEIDIPSSKIALRPGFPLRLLVDAGIRDRVIEALAWYLDQLASSDATTT